MNPDVQYGILTSKLEGASDATVPDGRMQAAAKNISTDNVDILC